MLDYASEYELFFDFEFSTKKSQMTVISYTVIIINKQRVEILDKRDWIRITCLSEK